MTDLTERLIGTCQICEGGYKVRSHVMVHHGFRRPGDGSIHGDCPGVGYVPYEVSCEETKRYRVSMVKLLTLEKAALARYEARQVLSFTELKWDRTVAQYVVGVTELSVWETQYESQTRGVQYRIAQVEREISWLTRMIDTWEPRDVRTSMEARDSKTSEERQARRAEVEAKREAKRLKIAATAARQAALAARREPVKQYFVEAFKALSKEPESLERTQKVRALVRELNQSKNRWLSWADLQIMDILNQLGVWS